MWVLDQTNFSKDLVKEISSKIFAFEFGNLVYHVIIYHRRGMNDEHNPDDEDEEKSDDSKNF